MKVVCLPGMTGIVFSFLCIGFGASPASADCFTTGTPAEAKECRAVFLSESNRTLNETYSALMKASNARGKKDLREEQRYWLKTRDEKCALTPGETSSPDWTTTILEDPAKTECVIQQTWGQSDTLAFSLRQQHGKVPAFPHSEDGQAYTKSIKPGDRLADYLDHIHKAFDMWDTHKDGVLTLADAPTPTSQAMFRATWGQEAQADHPLTWERVTEKGTANFRFMDINHDGVVSRHEIDLVQELQLSLELGNQLLVGRPECELPPPTSDAEIILLSAYEGAALASVGMHNTETRAGLINIQHGSRPLYVVLLTARPVIWRFEGDVSRIQRVVLSSTATGPNGGDPKDGPPLVGATGLKPSQIFFAPKIGCVNFFHEHPSWDSALGVRSLRLGLGRLPDVIATDYRVAGFSLPDGEILQPAEKGDARNWENLRSQVSLFYPGGVVPIDPAKVISSQKVQVYDVLPGVAGLRQLVERGALDPTGEFRTYRVTRKITLPAGLYGASSAKFIVPVGVPAPEGDPGHSCVMSEDGKVLAGMCSH